MANPKHVAALRTDVDEWNRTRSEDQTFRPDLTGADFSGFFADEGEHLVLAREVRLFVGMSRQ